MPEHGERRVTFDPNEDRAKKESVTGAAGPTREKFRGKKKSLYYYPITRAIGEDQENRATVKVSIEESVTSRSPSGRRRILCVFSEDLRVKKGKHYKPIPHRDMEENCRIGPYGLVKVYLV